MAATGDFVSYRSAKEYAELARALRHLPKGRLGTVASQFVGLGDYWSPEFGPTPGGPEHGLFEPLQAARDPFARRDDAVSTLRLMGSALPTVVLSHNPDAQDEPIWRDTPAYVPRDTRQVRFNARPER